MGGGGLRMGAEGEGEGHEGIMRGWGERGKGECLPGKEGKFRGCHVHSLAESGRVTPETPTSTDDRYRRRIQPVEATH